ARYNYEDYIYELKQKLQETYKTARDNIINSKEKSKGKYDQGQQQIHIEVDDQVWVKNHQQKRKLGPKWVGLYSVIQLHGNENITIQRGRKEIKLHKNEVKLATNTIIFGKTKANQFNITPIYNPSGIYFHSINNLRVDNSFWRFLTYVNITNYNEKYGKIVNMIKQIGESCKLSQSLEVTSFQRTCGQYKHQTNSFLTEINNNIEHIMRIIESPKDNHREKRGLINAVGRLANVLFGVCDDADAEYFYDRIKDLENSKLRVLQLVDTQTQIMRSIIAN
ncbi:Envelope fusion protein-like, partial [Cinara cedri]